MRYPSALERLIACFNRFQGIGRKTSERLVFELLSRWNEEAIRDFSEALLSLHEGLVLCPQCRTHVSALPCPFCEEERRLSKVMCIVASSKDVYSIESIGLFPGTFYVLNTLLSPLDERGVTEMDIPRLKERLQKEGIQEVIFALDSSLEGDATVGYLRGELQPLHIKITRLAAGVPVGASLEFVDRGTLSRAFSGRQTIE